MSDGKFAKVAVWLGGGPAPGYSWSVVFLETAGREFLDQFRDKGQQEYIRMQVQDLARHVDPTHSQTLSIGQVETFMELRDKGGGLGPKTNLRMYFDTVTEPHKCIRILGFDDKKNDGQIYGVVKDKIKRRQRGWDIGLYLIPEFPPDRAERLRALAERLKEGDSR